MPVGPGGEPLPYAGDPGAPADAPPAPGPQGGGQEQEIIRAFSELGGDLNQPENSPELLEQLAQQLGIPAEELLEIIITARESERGMDDDAYGRMRDESMQGASEKLSAQRGGPMGQTPPQIGGGGEENPGAGAYGAGQYRPRRM